MKYLLKPFMLLALMTVCTTAGAQGLKDAYKNYFKIGVALNVRNATTPEQMELVKKEFNSVRDPSAAAHNTAPPLPQTDVKNPAVKP